MARPQEKGQEPQFDGSKHSSFEEEGKLTFVLRLLILAMICVMAFSVRVFSVVRFESIIHEFDPWFNYRTTQYLAKEGFYSFWNWFDSDSWFPLGRVVGGTVYPGLMITASMIYWTLDALSLPIHIREACVFLAPTFSAINAMVMYNLGREIHSKGAGLFAAAFVGIVPSYISRSVAGSYDYEGVAIFAMNLTFLLWIKAVKTGTIAWSVACVLAYFYMVSSWGGYVFIINVIPIYTMIMVLAGKYSHRLYVAYCTFYVLGTLLAMQIPFVNFQAITNSEHLASAAVFVGVNGFAFLRSITGENTVFGMLKQLRKINISGFIKVSRTSMIIIIAVASVVTLSSLYFTGLLNRWQGRSLTLLDPTYAKKYIPIIASVSEHQPTPWSSFFFDLHLMTMLAPAGLFVLFAGPPLNFDRSKPNRKLDEASIFAILYLTLAVYFAGIMVRLMLVLAPAMCLVGGIGASTAIRKLSVEMSSPLKKEESEEKDTAKKEEPKEKGRAERQQQQQQPEESTDILFETPLMGMLVFTILFCVYSMHCAWAGNAAYSSPSVVLASRAADGSRVLFDDFREAYNWLNHNTDRYAKVMSWWDYGYQMAGMANKTTLVDNNTWNNTHIATVGYAMSSPENEAITVMRRHDVDYVLVIFGGVSGYSGDDVNKFLWMVRIGGGVYPVIQEPDYFSGGQYRVDKDGAPALLNCILYRMSYYDFWRVQSGGDKPAGFDRVRNAEVGVKKYEMEHLEEAFTSEHWIVRIFRVKKEHNRYGSYLEDDKAIRRASSKKAPKRAKVPDRPSLPGSKRPVSISILKKGLKKKRTA